MGLIAHGYLPEYTKEARKKDAETMDKGLKKISKRDYGARMKSKFYKFVRNLFLASVLGIVSYYGAVFGISKYEAQQQQIEKDRKQDLLDGVSIKMKYDRSQCKNDYFPLAVNIKNNTNKKIYKINYGIGRFIKGKSNDQSHKSENRDHDKKYWFFILKPNDSYIDCTGVPKSWFEDFITMHENGTPFTKEERKREKEKEDSMAIYRTLHREITFSDGEKVSGYSDMDDILLEESTIFDGFGGVPVTDNTTQSKSSIFDGLGGVHVQKRPLDKYGFIPD